MGRCRGRVRTGRQGRDMTPVCLISQQQEKPAAIEGDLATAIERLQKKEAFQSEEIARWVWHL